MNPAIDLRPIQEQSEDSILLTAGEHLYWLSKSDSEWSMTSKLDTDQEDIACFVLTNSTILVLGHSNLRFYSLGLKKICGYGAGKLVTGLRSLRSFKPLPCAKRDEFIMLGYLREEQLTNIQSQVLNSHTGDRRADWNSLVTKVRVTDKDGTPDAELESL